MKHMKRLLNDTPETGSVFVGSYLKDVFGFITHLYNSTYGSEYFLTLKRDENGNSIPRTIDDETRIEIKNIICYVRHDTSSFDKISLVNEHTWATKKTDNSFVSILITQKPVNSQPN